MTEIELWLAESIYLKPLSPACRLCAMGAKMVVLITGLCQASCFYCPLSMKKGGQDLIFADEWKLENEQDTDILIKEANLINAKGAGITGGDPLTVPKRTLSYIDLLKQVYGESFHIHLYTSGFNHKEFIPELASSGLDEIRFHPMSHDWKKMDASTITPSIRNALRTNMDVAIEIPVIPTMENDIVQLLYWSNNQQINWVNLNEFEFSERNEQPLRNRGFIEKNDISAAAKNSQDIAYRIIKTIKKSDLDIGVHYCSSSFKDGVQLKNRMFRRANHIAHPIDFITNEATILKGIIQAKNKEQIQILLNQLVQRFHLKNDDYKIIKSRSQLQIPIPLLEDIAADLVNKGFLCYISEQYPTQDQLEVERIPLPINIS